MSTGEYTIGEVAAMIGFSPHTIRAWERRHQVLQPRRTPSGQRRYTADDVDLLREVVNGVVVHGLSLKVAIQAARGAVTLPARVLREPRPRPAKPTTAPWRSVADHLSDVIAIVGTEGRIVDANMALASGSGCVRQQLSGRPFADFVEPYDRAKAVAAIRPPFRQRRGWELHLRLRGRSELYAFDCLPIRQEGNYYLILIGRQRIVPAS